MADNKINRRDFVKTAIGAGLAAQAFSQMHSAHARTPGANDHINIGVIGVGGRGRDLLGWVIKTGQQEATPARVVAVSDVYAKRLRAAKEFANCDGYLDYREIIERKDIDAVIIATPDHWHMPIACEALEKGKDVYLEKPMTRTVEEAKRVYENRKKDRPRDAGRIPDYKL